MEQHDWGTAANGGRTQKDMRKILEEVGKYFRCRVKGQYGFIGVFFFYYMIFRFFRFFRIFYKKFDREFVTLLYS